MSEILYEEIDNTQEVAKSTFLPSPNDNKNNNKSFKFFKGVEITRIVFSVLCIIAGVALIVFDNHIAINIGTISYKEGSITDISVNLGTLLCFIGLFFSFLSAKYLKIGE